MPETAAAVVPAVETPAATPTPATPTDPIAELSKRLDALAKVTEAQNREIGMYRKQNAQKPPSEKAVATIIERMKATAVERGIRQSVIDTLAESDPEGLQDLVDKAAPAQAVTTETIQSLQAQIAALKAPAGPVLPNSTRSGVTAGAGIPTPGAKTIADLADNGGSQKEMAAVMRSLGMR